GSRYYSSELSIWLSVDPMSDKYASLSPYVYCADNPIKLVDPNGEDYEVVVDNDNKTITIKAVYYTANKDREKLQQGLDEWNSQSGKYSFVRGKGDEMISYTINFELTIADGDFESTAEAAGAMPLDGTTNLFFFNDNISKSKRGETKGGRFIQVRTDAPSRTIAHEVGHTLGIGHFFDGLMCSGSDDTFISMNNIESSLRGAGILRIGVYTGTSEYEGAEARSKTQYTMFGKIKMIQ
ncbi:MAG: hypothetical protein J6T86_06640, partial [Bacteroidales bacterium]|nr:hypothetical protein [Bacteroidales bacterium]